MRSDPSAREGTLPSHVRAHRTLASLVQPPAERHGQAEVHALAGVHKALADPTRLRILQRLTQGDGTVGDLMRHVHLSQPLVSWHLRRLRAVGLVETRRAGRQVVCSLGREALRHFQDLEREWLGSGGRP
jgi:DNA-binding transcriptional ArsR family regulator